MNFENSEAPIPIVILDDPRRGEVVRNLLNRHSEKFVQVERKGRSLIDVLQDELFKMKTN
jgi:hypothetical protein